MDWEKRKETWRVINELKKAGFEIVALEQDKKAIPFHQTDNRCRFNKKVALVLGNEVEGLPKSILNRADKIVQIPMHGKKESLNVSVAFGIAVYKLREILYAKK